MLYSKDIKPTGSVTEMSVILWLKNTLISDSSYAVFYATNKELLKIFLIGDEGNNLMIFFDGARIDGPVSN